MTSPLRVEAWFDGAVEPFNPGGHGGYGALVKLDGRTVWRESKYIGSGPQVSSNVAEYCGAIACMTYLLALTFVRERVSSAVLRGDSMLVIKQLDGIWRVKSGLYMPFYREAVRLRSQLPSVRLEWVPRDQNSEADELSKQALRERGVAFNLQRERQL